MYVIVWEYEVRADHEKDFRVAYGPQGDWAWLFAQHDGFLGTELVIADEPGSYLTIDRWESEGAFVTFMEKARVEYEQLDGEFQELTVSEQLVGRGTSSLLA